ncbi:MAG: methyltransferase domain-containing protein [Deltaproteobacteria bacterium]|nr:methyltransferase domain-containing protein [Deltaproteobacteria bacterium]
MKKNYRYDFYTNRHQKTVYSANNILSIVVNTLPKVDSAVDFGCGVGTWLSILKEKGVKEILGIDGPWVEKSLLEIPQQSFHRVDLEDEIKLNRRYDLAISLEVAEHLRPEAAKTFVESLVNSSDFILFSAAIPFQGGSNHINEQWPNYWVTLFNERGYAVLDFIRREIWDEEKIPTWYRQNTLMFVKQERVKELKIPSFDIYGQYSPIALVHPNAYLSMIKQMSSVKESWKLFRRAVKKWVKQ